MRHEIIFKCAHGHIVRIEYNHRIPRAYVDLSAVAMTGGFFAPVNHHWIGYPCTQCGTMFTAEILERPITPESP